MQSSAVKATIKMLVRPATEADWKGIWSIIEPTVRAGETYALPADMSDEAAFEYWMGTDRETFVAEEDDLILGTYYLRANQLGGGSHVANAGYMTLAAAAGRGVARAMCEHSLDHARQKGFRAMQFNFVVSTNQRAIRLWESFDFKEVGRLPLAFKHPSLGFVDALVMYRSL